MNFGNNLNNSFRVDEINEEDNIESDLPSPIFKEDIGIVRMRKRRLKHWINSKTIYFQLIKIKKNFKNKTFFKKMN